ncbi:MAG: sulfite exporter TauE/SafE family protein [Clostridia bacterium]|nr:sulfite exporter TauE/SafE family protein [Clostridia bacterium]
MLVTLIIAVLTGMGVGSGGLFVIYLSLIKGVPQLLAQGLNLYFFIFSTAVALVFHARTRKLPLLRLAVICTVGSIGCYFGASLAKSVDPSMLRSLFAVLLIATGIVTLLPKRNFFKNLFTNRK